MTLLSNKSKTRQTVLLGLFFGIAIILSVVESTFPPIAFFPPGVKLGLANVVVMYCLFFLGKSKAFLLVVLKSMFVFLTRGLMAAGLSFCGGFLSVSLMILLVFLFKNKVSYLVLSILGAIAHNVGQLLFILIVFGNLPMLGYLPVLIITGIFAGIGTATILRFIMPECKRIFNKPV